MFLSAALLIMGGASMICGVHFIRVGKKSGFFRITMFLLSFLSGIWQIGYGLIGIVDDFTLCGHIRRFGIPGQTRGTSQA